MAPTGQTRRGRTARPGVTLGQIDRSVVVAPRFDDVWPLFATAAHRVLGAEPRREEQRLELDLRRPGDVVGRTVVVHLGGLVHLGGRAVVPVAWADVGGPGLYPVLRSVLEVAPADATGAAPTLLRL